MKKTLAIFFLLAFAATAFCQSEAGSEMDEAKVENIDVEQVFANANIAYDSGDYVSAAEGYSTIIGCGYGGWEMYYNLGNAYYRMGDMGRSILNYERAKRLAPTKKIIKDNLALARSQTADHIEVLPQLFFVEWFHAIVGMASPRGWRTIVVILTILFCAILTFFLVARDYSLRRSMFVSGTVMAVLLIISIVNATFSASKVTNSKEAVIVSPLVVVKSSPDEKSLDKFVLHDGTTVSIEDEQDDWWQIEIADGKSGWIRGGAERI